MGSSYLAGGGGTWPPGDPALTPSPRVLASLPPLCSRPAGRRLFRLQGSGQAPRGSRPLCRPQWEVRGPRHRSGEQTGWQTAPADVGGGRGRRGKRVSGLPSALACPRLVVGWGSRTAPLESPGAPSTRADDLREGHFFSDPFWEGPLGVRHPRTHPSAEAEKTHDNQTRARACGCACVRACVCPRVRSQACCLWARVLRFCSPGLSLATALVVPPPMKLCPPTFAKQEPLNSAGRRLPGRPSVFQTPPCGVNRI